MLCTDDWKYYPDYPPSERRAAPKGQVFNVNEYRDLGVIMDDKCLFKQHISSICRKAYITISAMFRCFHTANIDALI